MTSKISPISSLISFCIPTYNRVENLKIALPHLIEKIKKYDIKIFISDNASTDSTEEFVKSLVEEYPYIIYHKNVENIGGEANAVEVLKKSNTKYRWLLGDHYTLYDDKSLEQVIPFLKEDFDAIVVNYKGRKMFRKSAHIYTNSKQFIEELGWYIGMMAPLIYSKRLVEESNFEKYYGTQFTQSLNLLDYISKRQFKIFWLPQEITWAISIIGNKSWHNKVLETFAKNWYLGIMSLPSTYPTDSKLKCIKNHARQVNMFSFKNILLFRYVNGISINKILKNLVYFYYATNVKTIMLASLISLVPHKLILKLWPHQRAYFDRVIGGITGKYQ